jgi:hypothetical protein
MQSGIYALQKSAGDARVEGRRHQSLRMQKQGASEKRKHEVTYFGCVRVQTHTDTHADEQNRDRS